MPKPRLCRSAIPVLLLCAALVGCTAAPPPAPPALTAAPAAPTSGPVAQPASSLAAAPTGAPAAAVASPTAVRPRGEITFGTFGDPEEAAAFQAIVDGYNKSNPGATVKLNVVPSQGDFYTRLSASFAAGTAPDVFLIDYRGFAPFADKNVLEPLDARLAASTTLKRDQFFEVPLQAFTWKGALDCIPQNVSSMVVYYNKDLFQKNNVPLPRDDWKWNDFLSAAQALTRDTDGDGKVDQHGLSMDPQIIRAAPFVWSRGGRLVDSDDKPTRITLDDPETKEGLRFFVRLSSLHHVVPTEAEYKAQGPSPRFMAGKAAMTLNSRRAVPDFRTIKGFTWDVAAPPSDVQTASVLHSDGYCMGAGSQNKALAWDFMEYAIGAPGQEIGARLGRTVPSLKSVAGSPAFLDPSQAPANSKVWLDMAPRLKLMPVMVEWPQIERTINEELETAFYGTQPFDNAILAANEKANALLKR